jgi:C-terminal processing protease CtpA/Prc
MKWERPQPRRSNEKRPEAPGKRRLGCATKCGKIAFCLYNEAKPSMSVFEPNWLRIRSSVVTVQAKEKKSMHRYLLTGARSIGLAALLLLALALPVAAQDDDTMPVAEIENDEGGPVVVTGEVAYTNPNFTRGISEPMVILEDQTGFVHRDLDYIFPIESQTIGQITSNFFSSPFTYSLALPTEPQAPLNDVDNDGEDDLGVMVFAPAYWTNEFGDAFLEERDLGGGGWSGSYASTIVDPNPSNDYEYIGGTIIIYAPDDEQGFPSGWGDDGFLFTEDDPAVSIPAGYTIVNLDTDPFTFDRSREPVIDLIESEGAVVDDFSEMTYTEAFDAMIEKFRLEYAFTEFKELDWDAISDEFRPLFEAAEENDDSVAYEFALQDFVWSIPDGHVGMSSTAALSQRFQEEVAGGLGFAMRELDDGRVITTFVLADSPADQAGIELGAEIVELGGEPVLDVVAATIPWSSPFSTPHFERLQQLRYAIRFPLGTEIDVSYQNPSDSETTVTLETSEELDSFNFSSFNVGLSGFELPLDYEILDNGYVIVKIYSFFDDARLTIQLWERMIATLNASGAPGLIIDMRQNGGGRGYLADQLAAYFYDEPHILGNSGIYDEELGEFFFDPNFEDEYILPPENLRYRGPIAVLVGPACQSACEFFSYDLTVDNRAAIVGDYPTAGLGGGVEIFFMPGGIQMQLTVARAVDANGDIHIEGQGVVPDVPVPVTEETLFSDGDPVLEAAIDRLENRGSSVIAAENAIGIGEERLGVLVFNNRDRYTVEIEADGALDIIITGSAPDFDSYLRIYNEAGDIIGENDDLGESFDAGIEGFEVEGGTSIVVEVGTFADAGQGEYTLSVTESEGGE